MINSRIPALAAVAVLGLTATACGGTGDDAGAAPVVTTVAPSPTTTAAVSTSSTTSGAPAADDSLLGADAVTLTDDTGTMSVTVPSAWREYTTAQQVLDDGTTVAAITASPDLAAFANTFDAPGVLVLHSAELGRNLDSLVETFAPTTCTVGEVTDDVQGDVEGRSLELTDCGGTATAARLIVLATPETTVVFLGFHPTAADREVVKAVSGTIDVG